MKRAVVIIWLLVILFGIMNIFWYSDWKYSLPTPTPKNYHPVSIGTYVNIGGRLATPTAKPLFIHFFNPGCPCSRFNIPHFKSLVRHYGDKVSFAIVVLSKDKVYTAKEIQDKFDIDIPVSFDSSLATDCGVYSTPQAVLLNAEHHIYYRGNYNKSRYCTSKESNYAQMAIDSLLHNAYQPTFNRYALKAYGCELPVCNKN